ncbi:MAG: MBL fold metallo-hydrolase [Lachnospiraceae bacterium]|nr:MBL fold metallo-hydrolase [Lachnospiraceae bacterium]
MKITILGVRGSIPVEGADFLEFGGATSCVLAEADSRAVFLDAGSGLMHAPDTGELPVSVLLTHSHMDHIMGIPLSALFLSKRKIDIFLRTRNGMTAQEQLSRLMCPPLWPVGLDVYPSEPVFHDPEFPFMLGNIKVSGMEANHPGGSTIYRLDHAGKSLVYATDHEHTEEKQKELAAFAKDADLLLYDAQYTEEEYARMNGYGHSTAAEGLKLLEESGAKKLMFVHHDPRHTDAMLRGMEKELDNEHVLYARAGDVIEL